MQITFLFFFSVVPDTNLSANTLNNDLLKINSWDINGRWVLILISSKQVQEVIFSCKIKKPRRPVLKLNNNQVIQTPYKIHLSMFLDEKLNFSEHLKVYWQKSQYIHWAIFLTKTISSYYIQILYQTSSWLKRHYLWSAIK